MSKISADILVVGGGPAGLSAALAASKTGSFRVCLIDDNPRVGGQIWRAELAGTNSRQAIALLAAIEDRRVLISSGTQAVSLGDPNTLIGTVDNERVEFEFGRLVIATGAREAFLPFPGWTLPNVVGAGGLQALVKGGLDIRGKKVVVAGTGPLLLAVADHLKKRGAEVLAIVEQAPRSRLVKMAGQLWRWPSKAVQAATLRARLSGTPYLTGCWVTAAKGDGRLQAVEITCGAKQRELSCDYLACGFHLIPNTELASLAGCETTAGRVNVDELQRTSVENIYSAGETVGIGGVETSLVEGAIAGLTAVGRAEKARSLFSKRTKARKFGDLLNRTFELRPELKTLPDDNTIVCRCEDVDFGRLKTFTDSRTAKLQTRCGMGPCQGRVCSPATNFLFEWQADASRPPMFPVKLENL